MAIVIETNLPDFLSHLIYSGNSEGYSKKIIQEMSSLEQGLSLDDLIGKNIRSKYPKFIFNKVKTTDGDFAFSKEHNGYFIRITFKTLTNQDSILFLHRKHNGADCLTPLSLVK